MLVLFWRMEWRLQQPQHLQPGEAVPSQVGLKEVEHGVAGERLVRYACLANGKRRAGRGGLGAVLGADIAEDDIRTILCYNAARQLAPFGCVRSGT